MYFDYLWGMLEPLGVYRDSGYNLGELKALGNGMDDVQQQMEQYIKEIDPGTATGNGLSLAEGLFPMLVSNGTTSRREALSALFSVDTQWGSRERLTKTLEACGIPVTISESTEPFCCQVTMKEKMVIAKDPVFQLRVLECIMPCHMKVTVTLSYYDIRTSTTVQETVALEDLRKRSQGAWEQRLGYLE